MNNDRTDDNQNHRGDFQRSVERLEKAVQGFVSATNEHVTSKAAAFVDDTAARLERELRDRRGSRAYDSSYDEREGYASDTDLRYESRRARRHRRRQQRWRARAGISVGSAGYRTSRLYLDKRRRRVAGVCAGFARYFGVEVWVVRCMAITGLIFMPSVVVPAYIVAAIFLPKAPNGTAPDDAEKVRADHTSPAPELGPQLSPRRSLRGVQADLDQIELKLRRMESHVTSGQFELQRELKRIDV